jgi:hypothetical protein
MISLNQINFKRHKLETLCLMSFVATVSIVLAAMALISNPPSPASAQIVPSSSDQQPASSLTQDTMGLVQSNSTANITQLATVPTTVDQPIVPASSGPVNTDSDDDSDDSGDDDSGDDGDDSGDDDDDSGDDDDDDSGDDDGNGGGSVAVAGSGGAFAG